MNNLSAKFTIFLSTFFIFLCGCNSFVEVKDNGSLPTKQNRGDVINNQNQDNLKMADAIDISFSLEYSEVSLHEPVFLNFALRNNLEQTINLDLGQDRQETFVFTIVSPDGKELKLPQLTHEGISVGGKIYIKPEQNYTQKLLINQWIEFEAPGTYLLRGNLTNSIKTENGEVLPIDSNFRTEINVNLRNAKKLGDVSNALAQKILTTSNYEEKSKTALALGYINDSVAVPYLEKVLTTDKMVVPIIIKGLARIGNQDSAQILIDFVKENANSEDALLAKSALQRIDNQSFDANTKRLIREVLSKK